MPISEIKNATAAPKGSRDCRPVIQTTFRSRCGGHRCLVLQYWRFCRSRCNQCGSFFRFVNILARDTAIFGIRHLSVVLEFGQSCVIDAFW